MSSSQGLDLSSPQKTSSLVAEEDEQKRPERSASGDVISPFTQKRGSRSTSIPAEIESLSLQHKNNAKEDQIEQRPPTDHKGWTENPHAARLRSTSLRRHSYQTDSAVIPISPAARTQRRLSVGLSLATPIEDALSRVRGLMEARSYDFDLVKVFMRFFYVCHERQQNKNSSFSLYVLFTNLFIYLFIFQELSAIHKALTSQNLYDPLSAQELSNFRDSPVSRGTYLQEFVRSKDAAKPENTYASPGGQKDSTPDFGRQKSWSELLHSSAQRLQFTRTEYADSFK